MFGIKNPKRFLKKSYITTLREIRETKEMIRIYREGRRSLYPEARKQVVDLLKIVLLFPLLVLPGSAVILTVLEIVARFFKTSIFPSKQHLRGRPS
ncbi:MAG: hypothetical protein GXO19_00430 [Epsilonproteobacteria bacterium]|nr:hypothetical protein [Campylobacterota bacterium]NPA56178.1 hypothetical protein [Campylobacterota bacterium]